MNETFESMHFMANSKSIKGVSTNLLRTESDGGENIVFLPNNNAPVFRFARKYAQCYKEMPSSPLFHAHIYMRLLGHLWIYGHTQAQIISSLQSEQ